MFLKLTKLADPHLKQPLLVSVVYGIPEGGGAEEDDEGNAQGKHRFTDKVMLGETIDVTDEVGSAILSTYAKNFKVVASKPQSGDDQKAKEK